MIFSSFRRSLSMETHLQQLLALCFQVMSGSQIMNILATIIKHMTLGIILMNLQVSGYFAFPAFVEAGNVLLYLKLKYVIYHFSLIVTAATHYSQKVLPFNLLPSICRTLTLLTYCAPRCDSCFWATSSSVACQQIQRMEGKA